jgi:glyoxalase family protein
MIAAGIVHHVAFRTPTDEFIELQRAKVLDADLHVSPIMDRTYFHSIYFREPGGVLFEVATDSPGFDVDEPLAELGQSLKLPIQFERFRTK